MKDKIIESLKKLVSDRYFFVLVIFMTIQTLTLAIILALSIHENSRQLISHYSAFGDSNYYFGQWYYLFVFVAFGVVASILHGVIALKIFKTVGRSLAVMYVWFGIGVNLLSWIMALRILNLQDLL